MTFGEVPHRKDYATGYVGKWHLDGKPKPGWAPARRFGFEDNRYMYNRGSDAGSRLTRLGRPVIEDAGGAVVIKELCAELDGRAARQTPLGERCSSYTSGGRHRPER